MSHLNIGVDSASLQTPNIRFLILNSQFSILNYYLCVYGGALEHICGLEPLAWMYQDKSGLQVLLCLQAG
jgi:hypothetical protein